MRGRSSGYMLKTNFFAMPLERLSVWLVCMVIRNPDLLFAVICVFSPFNTFPLVPGHSTLCTSRSLPLLDFMPQRVVGPIAFKERERLVKVLR
jgi:hypothetical protein